MTQRQINSWQIDLWWVHAQNVEMKRVMVINAKFVEQAIMQPT